MKRFLAIILAVLLLAPAAAFADFDLDDISNMSDDELLELYSQVRDEMKERGLMPTLELSGGKYIVGQDIEPGTYKITCTSTSGEALNDAYSGLGNAYDALLGEGWGQLMGAAGDILESTSDMDVEILGDYGTVIKSVSMKTGDVVTLTLEENTALNITDGSCTIEMQ